MACLSKYTERTARTVGFFGKTRGRTKTTRSSSKAKVKIGAVMRCRRFRVWRFVATAHAIAREYFPDVSEEELNTIIWGQTGFPEFWPDSSKTPEENFRLQLAEAAGKTVKA